MSREIFMSPHFTSPGIAVLWAPFHDLKNTMDKGKWYFTMEKVTH